MKNSSIVVQGTELDKQVTQTQNNGTVFYQLKKFERDTVTTVYLLAYHGKRLCV